MQIRIGTRQDEKRIQTLNEAICREFSREIDLKNADCDLINIEKNYFYQDGIFLVVETEKEIVACAAASKTDDDHCLIRRICVAKPFRHRGLARQMLSIILTHAQRIGFKSVSIGANPFEPPDEKAKSIAAERVSKVFSACGFASPGRGVPLEFRFSAA